jgi:hypothetical protein
LQKQLALWFQQDQVPSRFGFEFVKHARIVRSRENPCPLGPASA